MWKWSVQCQDKKDVMETAGAEGWQRVDRAQLTSKAKMKHAHHAERAGCTSLKEVSVMRDVFSRYNSSSRILGPELREHLCTIPP